jgi:hypothetical protein
MKNNYRLESRMRENRPCGSEGGGVTLSDPYQTIRPGIICGAKPPTRIPPLLYHEISRIGRGQPEEGELANGGVHIQPLARGDGQA